MYFPYLVVCDKGYNLWQDGHYHYSIDRRVNEDGRTKFVSIRKNMMVPCEEAVAIFESMPKEN